MMLNCINTTIIHLSDAIFIRLPKTHVKSIKIIQKGKKKTRIRTVGWAFNNLFQNINNSWTWRSMLRSARAGSPFQRTRPVDAMASWPIDTAWSTIFFGSIEAPNNNYRVIVDITLDLTKVFQYMRDQ